MKLKIWAAVLVIAIAAAGYAGYTWRTAHGRDAARVEALAAARQFAVDFVSINAATVDQDLARVAVGATGDFGDEFQRGMPTVRTSVLDNKVEAAGTVLRAALVSADADSAVALVAVDATIKNAKAPDGRTSHYRIQLDLVRPEGGDRWLVSRLQFVG
jgi:Mce-associated membrane protein